MKQVFIFVLTCILFFSCQNQEKKEELVEEDKKVYDMYQPSEMALLMEQMYAYNQKIKQDILNGKTPDEFPLEFLKIHSAEMTKPGDRNAHFESFSSVFINAEKEVFNDSSEVAVEERFNNMVGICISCHQSACTGPIPRIKKLLIK